MSNVHKPYVAGFENLKFVCPSESVVLRIVMALALDDVE